MKLNDKVTLITGAADGIDPACAQRFSAEGSRVLLGDIDVARGERTTRSLREQGADTQFLAAMLPTKHRSRKPLTPPSPNGADWIVLSRMRALSTSVIF